MLANKAKERMRLLLQQAEDGGGVCSPKVVGSLALAAIGCVILLIVLFRGGGQPNDQYSPGGDPFGASASTGFAGISSDAAFGAAGGVGPGAPQALPQAVPQAMVTPTPVKTIPQPVPVNPSGGYRCPKQLSKKFCISTRARHVSGKIQQQCAKERIYCVFNKVSGAFVERTRCGDVYPAPC